MSERIITSWLTEYEAAKETRVDRRTIRRLIQSGRLRATDFGSRRRHVYRIQRADLQTIQAAPDAQYSSQATQPRRRRRRFPSTGLVAQFLPSI